MKPSYKCLNFIKNEEQCVLHAYLDQAGIPTIGWGSTVYPDSKKVKMGETISQTYADAVLKWELENKANGVNACIKGITLNQNQFDALVSFAYNVGLGALQTSTVLKRVRANPDDPTIADALLMWNKITKDGKKVESKGLTSRRKREAALYFTPV